MAKKKLLQDSEGQIWPITTADCVYLADGSKTVKKYIDDALAGKADSSHGTHVTWSTTSPKVAGTAAVGSEAKAARGDHVHAAQTSVSGNAGTATKLKTARDITIGNKTNSFNGTANLSYTLADIGAAPEDSMPTSILDYCTPDSSGNITNQDAAVQNWLNNGGTLYLPRDVSVYTNTALNLPISSYIFGGGAIYVATSGYNKSTLITINEFCTLSDITLGCDTSSVRLINTSLINIADEAHDVVIRNCQIRSRRPAILLEVGNNVDYLDLEGNKFSFYENYYTSDEGSYSTCLKFTGETTYANISNNVFECHNDVGIFFKGISIEGGDFKFNTITNNRFSAFNADGYFISTSNSASFLWIKISENIARSYSPYNDGQLGFMYLAGAGSSVERLNINGNLCELGTGYFIYSGSTNINNSTIVGNTAHNTGTGKIIVDAKGYHTIFSGNTLAGRWWGQTKNACIARGNINATLEGTWHTSSGDNIVTY